MIYNKNLLSDSFGLKFSVFLYINGHSLKMKMRD